MHSISIQGVDPDLKLVRFAGSEGLSRHFRFEVTFLTRQADLARADVVGRAAVLSMHVGEDPRLVHGIVARIEQGEEKGKTVAYRVEIVPSVHELVLRRTSRIFQDKTVPEIVAAVLAAAGVSATGYSLRLQGSYPSREYCVQYRESDWDFISRLCEEEGITYLFEHAEGGDTVVFVDGAAGFGPIAGATAVPFRPPSDAMVSGEAVSILRVAQQLTSDESTLRDYDFQRPGLLLEANLAAEGSTGLEVYDDPGEFVLQSEGDRLAEVRLQELTIERRTGRGDANVPRFVPGSTFELVEHPLESLNGKWLLTEVEHEGHDPGLAAGLGGTPYGNQFRVVPAEAPFRPARVTPRPVVVGSHTAQVVGPKGEEVHVDEHGRVKVQFHWDREGRRDDKSSCWIRVAQAWAGPAYGAVFLPRIGHEVVVSFLEGDPDRPLVTGSVYNGANVPPYALPAEKTKSTLKSSSSPGGGGFNELRFEDRKGQEEVFLHSQKDLLIETLNDKNQTTGHDETLEVGNDRSAKVGANEVLEIGASRTLKVGVNETDTIGANYTATVGANATIGIDGGLGLTLGGAFTESVAKSATISIGEEKEESIGKGAKESVGADKSLAVTGSFTTEVEKAHSLRVGGDASADVDGSYALTVGKSYVLECGDAKVTVKKNGDITIEGKKIVVKGSGPIEVSGSKLKIKSDGAVSVDASGTVEVKGSAVNVN